MATKTITDEEYQYLRGRDVTAGFVESIYNDPKLSNKAKALIKEKYPQLPIPEYDIEQKIENRFAQRDAEIKARQLKRQNEVWKQKRIDIQKRYGFTDDGMKDLEKFMVERNIGDYEVAATYKASKDPKPVDAQFNSQYWNHHKQDSFKEIAADPEAWGQKEIMAAIQKDMERAKNAG